jgi:hypothetical protein
MRNIEQAYKNIEAVYSGLTKKQRGRFIGSRLRLALGHLRDELKSNQEYPITRTTRGGDYYPEPPKPWWKFWK